MSKLSFCMIAAALCGLAFPFCFAQGEAVYYELKVPRDMQAFRSPKRQSDVVKMLYGGDVVVISPKKFGRYRKIIVSVEGKNTPAYILSSQIRRSHIKVRKKQVARPSYGDQKAYGVALVPSYMSQGESTFQLSDGSIYKTTTFLSSSLFFSAFMDFPVNERWSFKPYLSFRQTDFRGTAVMDGAPSGTGQKKIRRLQSLTGMGVVIKRLSSDGQWWWGGGVEMAMGSSLQVKINEVAAPTSDKDKPFFLMSFAAIGREIPLAHTKDIYIVPDLRFGIISTTNPFTMYAESFLGIGKSWR